MGSKLASHLQEIKRALDMTVDDKRLVADFKKLVEDYKVPVEEAKRSVIKKYAKVLAATKGLSVSLPNGQSIKGEQPRATVMHLSQLKSGDMGVSVVCRILETKQMDIETRNGPKDIISGVIADESARLPFTSWVVSPIIAAKNVVRIENAYVKAWQGIPTVNIGEHTDVVKVDDVLPPDTELSAPKRLTIGDAIARDGAFDVIVEGDILSIRPGSGLIVRCPECKRVLQKEVCRVHGKVDAQSDMRVKAILDDGTGALTIVLNRELTEHLYGKSMKTSQKLASEAGHGAVEEEIRRKLVGTPLAVRGNVSKGEYGTALVVKEAWVPGGKIEEMAKRLGGAHV
jgi:replication factor A1